MVRQKRSNKATTKTPSIVAAEETTTPSIVNNSNSNNDDDDDHVNADEPVAKLAKKQNAVIKSPQPSSASPSTAAAAVAKVTKKTPKITKTTAAAAASAEIKVVDENPSKKLVRTNAKVLLQLELPTVRQERGHLFSCGQNEVGQLGLGEDVSERKRPAIVPLASDIIDIRAGGMHSLYLTSDGSVYSFGCNDEHALGRDCSEDGSEYTPKPIELPSKCIKISAGDSHSACLLDDGRAFAWGSFRDSHGNMGLTLEGNKSYPIEVVPMVTFVDIVSGADHLVMLTDTGKMYTIGCGEQGQLGRVTLRSASGETRRGKRELLIPGMIQFRRKCLVNAIWASTYCTFFREESTSDIYAFGLNNYNQLGLDKTTEPLFVPRLTQFKNVKSITGGQHHTLILTNDHKCYAIGRKEYGRLGLGAVANDLEVMTRIKVLEKKKIIQISCGESCSFAVTDEGHVYAWGMGSNLQLGTGDEEDVYEPILLTGAQIKDKRILQVSSGGQHTLFLVESDKLLNNNSNNNNTSGSNKKQTTIKTNGTTTKKELSSSPAAEASTVAAASTIADDTMDDISVDEVSSSTIDVNNKNSKQSPAAATSAKVKANTKKPIAAKPIKRGGRKKN